MDYTRRKCLGSTPLSRSNSATANQKYWILFVGVNSLCKFYDISLPDILNFLKQSNKGFTKRVDEAACNDIFNTPQVAEDGSLGHDQQKLKEHESYSVCAVNSDKSWSHENSFCSLLKLGFVRSCWSRKGCGSAFNWRKVLMIWDDPSTPSPTVCKVEAKAL